MNECVPHSDSVTLQCVLILDYKLSNSILFLRTVLTIPDISYFQMYYGIGLPISQEKKRKEKVVEMFTDIESVDLLRVLTS